MMDTVNNSSSSQSTTTQADSGADAASRAEARQAKLEAAKSGSDSSKAFSTDLSKAVQKKIAEAGIPDAAKAKVERVGGESKPQTSPVEGQPELLAMAMAANAQAPSTPLAQAQFGARSGTGTLFGKEAAGNPASDAVGKYQSDRRHLEVSTSAEKSPATQRSAASTNAATAITGLKPWSSDWIFEEQGGPDPKANTGVRPLFGKGEDGESALAQALIAARHRDAGGDSAAGAPGMGTKGELGFGLNPKSPEADATRNAEAALIAREWLANRLGLDPNDPTGEVAGLGPRGAQLRGIANADSPEGMGAAGLLSQGVDPGSYQILPNSGYAGYMGAVPMGREGFGSGVNARVMAGSLAAQPPVWSRDLSGGEFLGTLDAVRGQGANPDVSGAGGRPSLRLLEGGLSSMGVEPTDRRSHDMDSLDGNSGAGGPGVFGQPGHAGNAPIHLEGQVTQGSMAQERLSSDALIGLSGGIHSLSQKGGGEMRVRLKPENLGELHLRVVTQGSEVGLSIQASDERSKKIIEDSLNHLRDSLASQNLNLGKVEVSVAQQGAGAGAFLSGDSRQDSAQQGQGQGHQSFHSMYGEGWSGQSQDSSRGRQQQAEAWGSADSTGPSQAARSRRSMGSATAAHVAGVGFQVAKGGTDPAGRLDVMA